MTIKVKRELIKYYQNNKEAFFVDCLQSDPAQREYLYNEWIEDFFTLTNN